MTLCSCRIIVPSLVTLPCLLFVQGKLRFQGFWEHLCQFSEAELTEHILVLMKLPMIPLHVLDCGFSTVPVLCHQGTIDKVIDAWEGFSERNPLTHRRVSKSCCENWNHHMPECFHLLTTPLRYLAIWLVDLSKARIWRHHYPEHVEFVNPWMFFEEDHSPVHQMLMHIVIDSMKKIG